MHSQTLPAWPHHHFPAMGSELAVWIDTDNEQAAQSVFEHVELIVANAEAVLSRYRADSDVALVNRHAGQWVTVSPMLIAVLRLSCDYHRRTNRLFDPTVTAGAGARIDIDSAANRVRIPTGTSIDLGGIGKGYIAGLAAESAAAAGPVLVDASGDLIAIGGPRQMIGWPVGIQRPIGAEQTNIATLWLKDAALATSGTDRHNSHIVDPRTAQPLVSSILTATVLSNDPVEAEVLATIALIDAELVRQNFDIGLLTISHNQQVEVNDYMNRSLVEKGF